MKIIREDYKKGLVELRIETLDDLWVLYNLLKEGDIVYAKTTREIKIHEGSQSARVPMVLGLRVKRVEFQQFSSKLRIGGVIVEGPEEYGVKGKHHTLSVGIGDTLLIAKESWGDVEKKLLQDYASRKGSILVLSVDFEEACVGVLSEQGIRYLWEETQNMPSKAYQVDYESALKAFTSEIARNVLDIAQRSSVDAILIVGPGEVKNQLKNELLGKTNLPIYTDTVSTGGCKGLDEALRRDIIEKIVGGLKIISAKAALEEFKQLLVKDHDMVSYGVREVYELARVGAIRRLVVLDELLRTPNDEERNIVYEALHHAYRHGAEVIVVPKSSSVGVELQGFGGMIAILRFKLYKV